MEIALFFLIILWFLGYITIPGLVVPHFPLFYIKGHPINLWDILVFIVIISVIDSTATPFREILITLLILWFLSTFGIVAIVGLPQLLVVGVIVALVLSIVSHRASK